MPVDTMFFVLLLVICGVFGYLAIPRVMRKWSVATKPVDERLEYAAHLGEQVDKGPSASAPSERERAAHNDQGNATTRQL